VPALASGGYQYAPSGSGVGWSFNAGAGIQRNGSPWGAAAAPDGGQTAFIQNAGAFSQALTLGSGQGTTAGAGRAGAAGRSRRRWRWTRRPAPPA
jgi:hypothetical protein